MSLVIDTHVLIRLMNGDSSLPYKIIFNADPKINRLYVSIASLWEIAIKLNLGKLSLNGGFDDILPILERNHISILEILPTHLKFLINLPAIHKDPFDRLIVSQCMVQKFKLATDDGLIKSYPGLETLS